MFVCWSIFLVLLCANFTCVWSCHHVALYQHQHPQQHLTVSSQRLINTRHTVVNYCHLLDRFKHTHTHTHTHNHFTALWTLSGITQVSWYQKVPFAIFCIFWCKMKITQADTPTMRMNCHPIQTNWCPHLCQPHHLYAGCPSWHNPPNLSWLGTGTKYAGLHTRWLG